MVWEEGLLWHLPRWDPQPRMPGFLAEWGWDFEAVGKCWEGKPEGSGRKPASPCRG